MPFLLHAEVVVTALGRRGRILEVGTKGRYRVGVGAASLWCREEELSPAPAGRKRGRETPPDSAPSRAPGAAPPAAAGGETARLGSLDLHGLTVDEALAAVEVRLDAAIRAGLDRIEIVHGIGGGRLRTAVHRYLRQVPAVERFALAPGNPGATWVWF